MRRAPHGFGIGFRPEIAADLLADPTRIDFVEVVAESCFADPRARREATALAAAWPVVPHGVKLSLGSAAGIDEDRAKRLGDLARELSAAVVTEHVALTRTARTEIGHLTAIPRSADVVAVVARNVRAARRHLPDVPLLLENIATTLTFPDDAMDEGSFYAEVVRRTGCDLLLDVANLYANAKNRGQDPLEALRRFPVESARMLHLAGGVDEDGFYFDTHAHAVPEEVFALLEEVFRRAGDIPLVLERDGAFPAFADLDGELARARGALARAGSPAAPPPAVRADAGAESRDPPNDLVDRQERLAHLLTADALPSLTDALSPDEVARSRRVLGEKRVDDALPLLPSLGRHRAETEAIARARLPHAPRPGALVAVADALMIAEHATARPELERAARLDRLVLTARFKRKNDGGVSPRIAPFIGREKLGKATVWAVKGPGANALVRVYQGDDR